MAILDPVLLGERPCKCGRLVTKRHCPQCGAYRIYHLASKKASKPHPTSGEMQEFEVFRCMSCGRVFDDTEWKDDNCNAPLYRSKTTMRLERLQESYGSRTTREILTEPTTDKKDQETKELLARAFKIKEERMRKKGMTEEEIKKALEA